VEKVKEEEAVVAIIQLAKQILSKDGAWTKGALAKKADNMPTTVGGKVAVSFCSIGALQRAKFELAKEHEEFKKLPRSVLYKAKKILAEAYEGSGRYTDLKQYSYSADTVIISHNDGYQTSKKDVLSAFGAAEKLACKKLLAVTKKET